MTEDIKSQMSKIKTRKTLSSVLGQSLFEVLVTVAIMALFIVGVVSLATTSIRNSTFSRNNAEAAKYALEATEWLREQRDEDWDNLIGHPSNTCLGSLTWGSACTIPPSTIFSRSVTLTCFEYVAPNLTPRGCGDSLVNTVEAEVKVSWRDQQGEHEVKNVARFTSWNID